MLRKKNKDALFHNQLIYVLQKSSFIKNSRKNKETRGF